MLEYQDVLMKIFKITVLISKNLHGSLLSNPSDNSSRDRVAKSLPRVENHLKLRDGKLSLDRSEPKIYQSTQTSYIVQTLKRLLFSLRLNIFLNNRVFKNK